MLLRLFLLKLRRLLKYRIFPLYAVLLDHVFEPGIIRILGPSKKPTRRTFPLPLLLPLLHTLLALPCPHCVHRRRPRCLPGLRLTPLGVAGVRLRIRPAIMVQRRSAVGTIFLVLLVRILIGLIFVTIFLLFLVSGADDGVDVSVGELVLAEDPAQVIGVVLLTLEVLDVAREIQGFHSRYLTWIILKLGKFLFVLGQTFIHSLDKFIAIN